MLYDEAVTIFRDITHPDFNLDLFHPIFMKAAWKAYRDIECEHVLADKFQSIINPLFDALFIENGGYMYDVTNEINNLFPNTQQTEQFLNNTFHIILNLYIKSFYGVSGGWEKIIPFANAIEYFITNITDQNNKDKSHFLFQHSVIASLEILRHKNKDITLYNTYCGVPIQYEAQVIESNRQGVLIKAHPIQNTAAVLQNGIHLLKNEYLPYNIYASVTPKYMKGERYLELYDFKKLETSFFQRTSVRVHPPKPFVLEVIHNAVHLKLNIFDISLGGVATTSKHNYTLGNSIEATLYFPTEIIGETHGIKGYFVFTSSYEEGKKYHFKMNPTRQQEFYLSKYIARRQQEIIKMLRDEIV
ncbi:hypothetical protein [Sulfuricurvum sp.]|uniref:hypothetical protein n=1 Tax=Sulfuricurvum sp. TaxID=2025608 RepID=UPI003BB5301B